MTNSVIITGADGTPSAPAAAPAPQDVPGAPKFDQGAGTTQLQIAAQGRNLGLKDDRVDGPSPGGVLTDAQIQRYIADPRYRTDAGFRAQVMAAARHAMNPAKAQALTQQGAAGAATVSTHPDGEQSDMAADGEADADDAAQDNAALAEAAEWDADDLEAINSEIADFDAALGEGSFEGVLDAALANGDEIPEDVVARLEENGFSADAVRETAMMVGEKTILGAAAELGFTREGLAAFDEALTQYPGAWEQIKSEIIRGKDDTLRAAMQSFRDSHK